MPMSAENIIEQGASVSAYCFQRAGALGALLFDFLNLSTVDLRTGLSPYLDTADKDDGKIWNHSQ